LTRYYHNKTSGISIPIPHGILLNTSWIRHVDLQQITGYDEQLVIDMNNQPYPFRTTALLANVIHIDNDEDKVSLYNIGKKKKIVQQLTIGDRIALLLNIRKMTFGDKLSCILSCSKCKEKMSFELSASHLLKPPVKKPKAEYIVNIEGFTLKIRPVNGADLESLFLNNNKQSNKTEQLVRNCIISSKPQLSSMDTLDKEFLTKLSNKLEEIDPQANLLLDLECPACNDSFQVSFDVEDFILNEINMRQKQLEHEVHLLASIYHWSERSILSIPLGRRKRYVDLITKSISEKTHDIK